MFTRLLDAFAAARPPNRAGLAHGALAGLTIFLLALLSAYPAYAADAYPALTGRVVDNANVIPQDSRNALETKLTTLEDKSGIQLVVATVPSLGGNEIEPYANGLFRFWKLGEQKKNNGVLLLVAPTERKVRIEVGYGEEGVLTDALSKIIITNAMIPRFKSNDYAGGIARGVDDVIAVLTTDTSDWQKRPDIRADEQGQATGSILPFLVIFIFVLVIFYLNRQTGLRAGGRRGGGIIFLPTGGGGWGGGWSGGGGGWGGGDGGGFSGGGGSSGGGGASGGW